jgi:pimeloyl-ACP methyl ester carboxylesterase
MAAEHIDKDPDLLKSQLPPGVSSRYVDCPGVQLKFHFLESGYDSSKSKPLILLLHGFPELAFSWRKVIPTLAEAGYHVVAPDQRGYGRTTGWDASDLAQFSPTSLVRDIVVFVHALGYKKVHCVVGHDFGAASAAQCAMMRPDIFQSMVIMSYPFRAIPEVPFGTAYGEGKIPKPPVDIGAQLAKLPEPRKHYGHYNCTETAPSEWGTPKQGLHKFFRQYIHVKSADWERNDPHPLGGWTGEIAAQMPYYYIMPIKATMPEVAEILMKGEDETKTLSWMPDATIDVYVQEWSRTGFQGALNWFKARTKPGLMADMQLFASRQIEIPVLFLSGEKDWGNYQEPGSLEALPETFPAFKGKVLVEAGHWPQQEQPERVAKEIVKFAGL